MRGRSQSYKINRFDIDVYQIDNNVMLKKNNVHLKNIDVMMIGNSV